MRQSSFNTDGVILEETQSQSILVAVDKIFTSTVKLSGPAIVEFVRWLCHVSAEEIAASAGGVEQPRMYSLQKLVEVCYYNMDRLRMEWSQIWAIVGDHFNFAGCHQQYAVANFAVDSLKQMSLKFLEKEELPHFKFQKEFLRPFEYIMAHNDAAAIKEYILICVNQLVELRGDNIKSGWKSILAVLTKAAREEDGTLVLHDLAKSTSHHRLDGI